MISLLGEFNSGVANCLIVAWSSPKYCPGTSLYIIQNSPLCQEKAEDQLYAHANMGRFNTLDCWVRENASNHYFYCINYQFILTYRDNIPSISTHKDKQNIPFRRDVGQARSHTYCTVHPARASPVDLPYSMIYHRFLYAARATRTTNNVLGPHPPSF